MSIISYSTYYPDEPTHLCRGLYPPGPSVNIRNHVSLGPPISIGNNIPPGPSVNIEDIHNLGPSSAGPSLTGYYVELHFSGPPLLHSSTPPLLHSSTPPLLHSSTPPLLHSSTPPLLHSSTPPPPYLLSPDLLSLDLWSCPTPPLTSCGSSFPLELSSYLALDFVWQSILHSILLGTQPSSLTFRRRSIEQSSPRVPPEFPSGLHWNSPSDFMQN
ncbi:hypothetical protein BDR07DRAFT_1499497 [Suillus spraguei]|nr:hypothetical protein BDR07DRAFT_1499497 [Suillus spraguei]